MIKKFCFLFFSALFAFCVFSQSYYGAISYGPPVQVNDIDTLKTLQIHPAVMIKKIDNQALAVFSAWEDDRDGNGINDIYFSMPIDTGRTFSADINLTPNILNSCRYPSIAVDKDGNVFVVFQVLYAANPLFG